jgi:predicted  nucleic acid-binding Zn-ribbon protein
LRDQIELLTSLQKLDSEIRERSQAKGVLLAELKKGSDDIEARQAGLKALRLALEEKEKARQERERTFQEESRRAVEKRMRMSRIKNLKELQSLQREIDQIKQSNAQLEEEVSGLMEVLDGQVGTLLVMEEQWEKRKADVETQCAEIEKVVADSSEVRKTIAARINGELVERYDLIFSRRGGMAVVAVSDGICQGCYMNIRPQLLNEILRGERVHICPSCHRILYYKPTIPSDKQV